MSAPDHGEFREQARAWLSTVAEPVDRATTRDGSVAIFETWTPDEERLADPRPHATTSGRSTTPGGVRSPGPPSTVVAAFPFPYELIFRQVEAEFDLPRRTEIFPVTQQLVAPAVAQWGTPEQVQRQWLRAMLRADTLICQLFSEPAAGSDLASVRTTARPAGDGWSVQGQKVWTSGASVAELGLALCRTDSSVAKHAGLTMFVVPLDAAGVELAPDPPDDGREIVQRGVPRRRAARRRRPTRPGGRRLEGRPHRAGRGAARLRLPRPRQRRPGRRAGAQSSALPPTSWPTWSPGLRPATGGDAGGGSRGGGHRSGT